MTGQTGTGDTCGGFGYTHVQDPVAGPPTYTVPSGGGVLTSWSHQANSDATTSLRLKVYRRTASPSDFVTVGHSAVQSITPGGLNSFPTQISVQEGDVLGISVISSGMPGCVFPAVGGNQIRQGPGDPPVGNTTTFSGPLNSRRVNISAVLEPGADNDGFGDETQDQCPTSAANPGGPCPVTSAPVTQITKRPKDKTKKKTATFEFSSSEPGSTFECSLDGGAFAPCTSPDTLKVKKGKHSFAVRSRDAAGNVDGSPASDDWKVKKKK